MGVWAVARIQSEVEALATALTGNSKDIFVLPLSLGNGAYLEWKYNLGAWIFTNEQ